MRHNSFQGYFLIVLTIQAPGGTWGCRHGPPPLSLWCQWSTSTHWCWPGCSGCSLCQNWTGLFSCCNYPRKDENVVVFCENKDFDLQKEKLAVVFIRLVKTIWSLITAVNKRDRWHESLKLNIIIRPLALFISCPNNKTWK